MKSPTIKKRTETPLKEFLESQNYAVEEIKTDIYKVTRDELEVFVKIDEQHLFFEVDLGDISEHKSIELYELLLDLNTEILPVSLGLDKTSSEKNRLLIVESRETKNLDENEILSVFEAMSIAYLKVSGKLETYFK